MSGRSYLSIGDVLTLLRQEFPDVTISKIRFLESQGLVNPERTPSGYRKFYDQDVERLRWVLRQQREHFLPLKVIKGRLDQGDESDDFADLDDLDTVSDDTMAGDTVSAHTASAHTASALTASAHTVSDDTAFDDTAFDDEAYDGVDTVVDDPRRHDVSLSAPAPTAGRHLAPVDDGVDFALDGDELDGDEDESVARRPEPVLVGHGAPLASAGAERARSGGALPGFESPPPPVGPAEMTAATFAGGSEPADPAPPAVAASAGRRSGTSRPATSRGAKAAATAAPAKAAAPPAGTPPGPAAPMAAMSGTDMTVEELATATGSTVGDIQQLVSFGLIVGRKVGGVDYYDDSALAVARAAAGFAAFGIEARHLRVHKLAAEREAGFIEQIVLPLLKQRNPESRQRAVDNVAELSRLGASLRAVLLRNALRDQLGG